MLPDSQLRMPRLQAFGTCGFSMACAIVIPQFGNTLSDRCEIAKETFYRIPRFSLLWDVIWR